MTVTVGVIGCGNIARFHFSGLKKAGVAVKWVCDLNPDAARPWAEKFGARYTASYRDVVDDPEVTVVDITAISAVHKEVALAAIGAGKAVICEKTLAENAADAWDIVSAAERNGTLFFTSYMKRYIPAVEKAKELLPQLGRLLNGYFRAFQCWGDLWGDASPEGAFKVVPGKKTGVVRNYGGGILLCGGSHLLDLVGYFFGRPRRLYASVHYPDWSDFETRATALLETDVVPIHFEALAHPWRKIGFLRDGWDERIEINGRNGRIEIYSALWDRCTEKASLLVHYDNATGNASEYRFDPVSPFDLAMERFCRWIEVGTQGEQSRLTGYEVDELIENIFISSREQRAVEISWRK